MGIGYGGWWMVRLSASGGLTLRFSGGSSLASSALSGYGGQVASNFLDSLLEKGVGVV